MHNMCVLVGKKINKKKSIPDGMPTLKKSGVIHQLLESALHLPITQQSTLFGAIPVQRP